MWGIPVILYLLAALVFDKTGYTIQFWISLSAALLSFLLWRTVYKRSMGAATRRLLEIREKKKREGRPKAKTVILEKCRILPTPDDVSNALFFLILIHIVLFLGAIIMIVWGFIILWF